MNNKIKDLCKAVDTLLNEDWYAALSHIPDYETAPYLSVLAELERARNAVEEKEAI